ncbi:MAG: peptidoglycan-binding protein, partial [Patescibacteria group bacterium]
MKRYLFIAFIVFASGVGLFGAAGSATAVTGDDYSQIQELIQQISVLKVRADALRAQQSVSGVVTVPSKETYVSVARNLNIGSRGDDVRGLQAYLRSLGHFAGTDTGYYGPVTSRAVASWQTSQGISATGTIGPISRRALATSPTLPKQIPYPGQSVIACTQDAMQCPDGRSVGRTGPNCQFVCTPGKKPVDVSGKLLNAYPTNGPATLYVTFTVMMNNYGDYTIDFGDGTKEKGKIERCSESIPMNCTVERAYLKGNYTATLLTKTGAVADKVSIVVTGSASTACTREYAPVCGRPAGCANTCPAGALCTAWCRQHDPVTYSNKCSLKVAGAELLYSGVCTSTANTTVNTDSDKEQGVSSDTNTGFDNNGHITVTGLPGSNGTLVGHWVTGTVT